VYTLSPLTILMLPLLLWLATRVWRDASNPERRMLGAILLVAVVLRLVAISGLFLFAPENQPFATFFGDEEMFKFRSVWLRNIGLGVPISAADVIYAVEETGKSQYLYVLALLQALVGDAPYGIHVFNMTAYLAGVILLYRLARASYGRLPAIGGLVVLLFLPSLFIWSVSALKEPLYTLLAALELICVAAVVRTPRWSVKLVSILAIVAIAFQLEGLRKGGLLVAGAGSVLGIAAAFIVTRTRLLLAATVAATAVVVALVVGTGIEERVLSVLRTAAEYHTGHVYTPGYSYLTLDNWYYTDTRDIQRMPMADALAYAARSLAGFVFEPLPWAIESRALIAYLPEYAFWLSMIVLVPAGFVVGLRRDALITCLLTTHGLILVMMIALTSGNVGTLIRHRGLALPYIVWIAALAACELIRRVTATRPVVRRVVAQDAEAEA
jgi:hypothetical protein